MFNLLPASAYEDCLMALYKSTYSFIHSFTHFTHSFMSDTL